MRAIAASLLLLAAPLAAPLAGRAAEAQEPTRGTGAPPAPAAAPATASHRAAAAELLLVTETERHIREGIDAAFDQQTRANPLLAPFRGVMQTYADKYLDWASLQPELVGVYVASFSEAELRDMIAFYRTPTGRKVVRLLPQVTEQVQRVAQQRVEAHLPELQAMIQQRAVELQRTPAPAAPAPPAAPRKP